MDLSKIKKIFFIGIGGIGISAIARMMFLEGKEVSGSDMSENELTHELKELGIKITIGQGFELIPTDTDLIVYTIAIPH
ncbi:UDP-N-acetylmuramate--L-alanine ligase, partial [Candidatus Nomurabacteria bacterium]|nr:UDP-N-acetylmuramate--L-alanine ligase [Candidatus Nomurabacteria bacterium]